MNKKLQKQIKETNLLFKSLLFFIAGIVGLILPVIPGVVLIFFGIKYLRKWYKE